MSESSTITDQQVASIAQRLSGEGRELSPLTVWNEIRSGSIIEVANALQRWKAAQEPQAAPTPVDDEASLPQGVAETLLNAAHQLWAGAHQQAGQRFQPQLRTLDQRLTATLAERDEALAGFQQADEEAGRERQQRNNLAQALQASEQTVEHLRSALADVSARAETAERRVEELTQRESMEQGRLAAAIASFEEAQRSQEALAASISDKDDELARIARERDEARHAHEALTASVAAKDDEIARIVRERDDALNAATVGKHEEIARIVQEHNDALHAAVSQKDEEIARFVSERDDVRQAHEALSAHVASKDDEIGSLVRQRDEARQRAEALQHESQAKSDEAQRYAHEAGVTAERVAAVEQQANERFARIAELEVELDAARGALNELQQAHAAKHDEATAQSGELQRVARELEAARSQISALNEQKDAASADAAQRAQDAAAARERAENAEQQAALLQERLAEQEQREADARSTHASQRMELEARGVAVEGEIAALQRQITTQAKDHTKAYDKLRTQAEEWVSYAKDLKQRLDGANEKLLFIDARSTGEVALMRRLALELERLKPDHELVLREAQQRVIGDKMVQQLAQKGYRYDPATSAISKIEE
ncbi:MULTISPECIES: DNA-binding protein [unclassified Caballeronia]|uniref:DNA-binding protein n=1 Tax=unclassified Caballeronia TaxID=2646786 RepID=UPI001FD15DC2|nr:MULTISPECIES: DNA-binding protein [unclassified Caballeronia]